MDNLFNLLKENGIELIFIDLEKHGYYNPQLKMIFINRSLSEEKQKEVILHELGHVINHEEFSVLYNKSTFRLKMENEATYYMMSHLINESDGHFNYSDVFDRYKLGLGWERKLK